MKRVERTGPPWRRPKRCAIAADGIPGSGRSAAQTVEWVENDIAFVLHHIIRRGARHERRAVLSCLWHARRAERGRWNVDRTGCMYMLPWYGIPAGSCSSATQPGSFGADYNYRVGDTRAMCAGMQRLRCAVRQTCRRPAASAVCAGGAEWSVGHAHGSGSCWA